MGQELLREHILDALMPNAEAILETPVSLHVSPRSLRFVEGLSAEAKGLKIKVVEDAALSDGQVFLRFDNGAETLIDMDRAVQQIMTVVNTFFDHNEQDRKYG
jgi:flagellar biosynthesis/type III secretory pathway protein FliH